ncbi:DUF935 family protein [uncultured Thiodictyon sp.]|uniref:phage portal protein family protein n=1 Tax=uncultured Thiodictyon sp. TaxID=1846217 RepID=UPI0025D1DF43|nr:DUF935 family protein [uncultured Thiodictyon sp.]
MLTRVLNAAQSGLARLLREPKAVPSAQRPVLPTGSLDGLTPARLTSLLRSAIYSNARDYLELAERMEEADLHYRSQIQTRRLALEGLEVRVAPAGDRGMARRLSQGLEEMTRSDWWGDLTALSDGIAKGYGVAEVLWDTSGSEWRPGEVILRPQRWFRYDRDDGRTLRLEDGTLRGLDLQPYGFVVHEPALKAGLPIRAGLARAAGWAYLLKMLALRRWSIAGELSGVFRTGRYPAGTPDEDIDILKAAVAAIGLDGSAVFPASMMLDVIAPKGANGTDIQERLCRYLDEQVSKCVVGQTMTADNGASLSQAKVHNEVRLDILSADARALTRTINRQVVRPWVDLNFGPQPVYPQIEMPVEWPEDLVALATALEKLTPLGLDAPLSWVRRKWAVPEPMQGEAVLGAPAAAPGPDPAVPAVPVVPVPQRALQAQGRDAPAPDGIDALVDAALADWEADLAPLHEPLRAAMAALGPDATAADAIAMLPGLLARMDADPLAARLTQLAYTARLAGAAGIEPD